MNTETILYILLGALVVVLALDICHLIGYRKGLRDGARLWKETATDMAKAQYDYSRAVERIMDGYKDVIARHKNTIASLMETVNNLQELLNDGKESKL